MVEDAAKANGDLDREIVLSRLIDAPRDRVFRAWIEPDRMLQWFGPRGYHCEVRQVSPAEQGAVWRFDMVAPNGQLFDTRLVFLEVLPDQRIVFDHGKDKDDDPDRFRVTLTFDQESDGKTMLTLRQLHPSKARRDHTIGFGAVELGNQTLEKLDAYLHDH